MAQATSPPLTDASSSPFQTKAHTLHAVLCGDFNLTASEPLYAVMQAPFLLAGEAAAHALGDAWPLAHGAAPYAPTFRLFDRTYGPEPVARDIVFVSECLAAQRHLIEVDGQTRASDHQPVMVELGWASARTEST